MAVTLGDVAREAGVSLATASRAINGSASRTVRPDLRARVEEAAARLRYTPDANAQAMARGRTTALGLVVPDIADARSAAVASGVVRAADRAGLHVTLACTVPDPARAPVLVDTLRRQRVRAIVLAGGHADEDGALGDGLRDALDAYRSGGGGAALVGRSALGVDSVVVDDAQGAGDLARALHGRGYRRFAVLAGPEHHLGARERHTAFAAALDALGAAPVRAVHGDLTHAGGTVAADGLLDGGDPPELVFAVTDELALGALAALRRRGLRVPQDVALAGFGDTGVLRDVVPGLTTVRVPLAEIGETATELALSGSGGPPRQVRVPVSVVLRASTPPRG